MRLAPSAWTPRDLGSTGSGCVFVCVCMCLHLPLVCEMGSLPHACELSLCHNPWAHTDSRLNDLPPPVCTEAHCCLSHARHTHTHTGTPPFFNSLFPSHSCSSCLRHLLAPCPLIHLLASLSWVHPYPYTFSSCCSIAGGARAAMAAGRWMGWGWV